MLTNYLLTRGKKHNPQIYLCQASAINLTDSFSKPSDKAKIGFRAKTVQYCKSMIFNFYQKGKIGRSDTGFHKNGSFHIRFIQMIT
jgi:hypothetical protein